MINEDTWDNSAEGEITLSFFAQDKAGNIGSDSVVVIKRIPSEAEPTQLIPGYNLFIVVGILSVVAIFISKKARKT